MTTKDYMLGRKGSRGRPQGMLWADNPGTLVDGLYVPAGLEIGANPNGEVDPSVLDQFIILSDDNRQPIGMKPTRIEQRQRMINGRMRSYHIADKLAIDTSWNMLPSRSFNTIPSFNADGVPTSLVASVDHDNDPETPNKVVQPNGSPYYKDQQYTTDGGAGGVEILNWYNNHQGSFWVYLAYDNYKNFNNGASAFNNLNKYNEVIEVFFSDFQYSIERRGGLNYDFWNITVSLEEV